MNVPSSFFIGDSGIPLEVIAGSVSADELVTSLDDIPQEIRGAVRNHGGGHSNHSFFWKILKKDVAAEGPVVDAIKAKWGSLEKFQEEFNGAAMAQFGSGWAWLVSNDGDLEIVTTANQDSPLSMGMKPLLGVDVWEHAYYLNYQNKRPEYLKAFWQVVNWEQVNSNFERAKGGK